MNASLVYHARALRGALVAALLLSLASPAPAPAFGQTASFQTDQLGCEGCRWLKGNTHAHTTESDGDSPPEQVARWYKEHGYSFLVLSDHDVFTDPATLAHLVDSTFLLVPGEELTSSFDRTPVHVNGLSLHRQVEPQTASTLVGTVQANVDAVRAEGGISHINHPNYGWAFGAVELSAVEDYRLLEIFNGHPDVHNLGGGGYPGMEEVWDLLLTRGRRVYGIAVDDAHTFQGEFSRDRANPGRGWVVVMARALEAGAIMEALEAGRFYASTGVELEEVRVTDTRLDLRVRPRGRFRFTTDFIGDGGRVLKTVYGPEAAYELQGHEGYVRAVVRDSGGAVAWVQPAFVERR